MPIIEKREILNSYPKEAIGNLLTNEVLSANAIMLLLTLMQGNDIYTLTDIASLTGGRMSEAVARKALRLLESERYINRYPVFAKGYTGIHHHEYSVGLTPMDRHYIIRRADIRGDSMLLTYTTGEERNTLIPKLYLNVLQKREKLLCDN